MNLSRLLLVVCATALLFSCNKEAEFQGELINVKLSPSFISVTDGTDSPMAVKGNKIKMAVNSAQIIYAIQIYENDSAYAYGLFDKVDSMKVALTTGKKYRFKVTTCKVGTGNGLKQDVQTDGTYFYLPVKTRLGNKFIKGNAFRDINKTSSIVANTTVQKEFPEIDLFYCDKTITLEKGLTNIDFSLLRMGFGVTYTVDKLTNGKLYVIMGNDTSLMNSSTTSLSTIRLFKPTTGDLSTIYAATNNYTDSISLKFKWVGTNGTVLETQEKFKFTRNYQKAINIQLNTTNFNINFEDWGNATVTDVDGNIYKTITIGTQTWMVDNLKTTHYRNGDPISNITDNSLWVYTSAGAYCWYNNDILNKAVYGALYNGFAVKDSRNIAPLGWHVATRDEWNTIISFLGGVTTAGSKMKESGTNHWTTPNSDATNESGFTALPGGYRHKNTGAFQYMGTNSFYRTGTEELNSGYDSAYHIMLFNINANVTPSYSEKVYGYSVRCVKD